jgi:hypothetical protein
VRDRASTSPSRSNRGSSFSKTTSRKAIATTCWRASAAIPPLPPHPSSFCLPIPGNASDPRERVPQPGSPNRSTSPISSARQWACSSWPRLDDSHGAIGSGGRSGIGPNRDPLLKLTLEQLLGAPCCTCSSCSIGRLNVEQWRGRHHEQPEWDSLFDEFSACVNWRAAAFNDVLMDHFPSRPPAVDPGRPRGTVEKRQCHHRAHHQPCPRRAASLEHILAELLGTALPDWHDHDAAVAAPVPTTRRCGPGCRPSA